MSWPVDPDLGVVFLLVRPDAAPMPPPWPNEGTEVGMVEGADDGLDLECWPEPRLPPDVLVGVAVGLGLRFGVWLGVWLGLNAGDGPPDEPPDSRK